MPLPSSGAISISQIRTELGTSDGSLRNLSSLAGKSTPDAMSEFYGYSATPTLGLSAERNTVDETCYVPLTVIHTVTYSGTLGIGTIIDGITVTGNNGFFLILTHSPVNSYVYRTIGIDDDNEVVYLESYCTFLNPS